MRADSEMIQQFLSDPQWLNTAIVPALLFGFCITCLVHLKFMSNIANSSYFKQCSLPGVNKSNPFLLYFMFLKNVFNRSGPAYPALCLILEGIRGMCRVFDKEKMFRIYLCFKPVVFFYKPETVETVLSSTTMIDKSMEYNFLQPWLGTGLLTSTGNKWRYRRKLLTPTFHFSILENFIPVFFEQSNVLVSKLETLTQEPWVDIVPLVTSCTLDIICQTAMGVPIDAQKGGCSDYVNAIHEVGHIFLHRALRPWLYPDFVFHCTSEGRKFKRNIQIIHDFTRKVIKEKKACMAHQCKSLDTYSDAPNASPSQRKRRLAFLEMLLKHHFKDPSFTEEDIREEVDTFMFEGHDTTAMALSWTLFCLGQYKEVQNEVHAELDEIFEGNNQREITQDDLKRMKYLECVIKETLRLYPSVPFIGREAQETFKVLNYTIQKSSLCLILPLELHQDSKAFPDPQKFDPERFFPENSIGRHPYAYVPFSAGPRNCIGQKFALMEEKTVLANILRSFKVSALDPRDKVNVTPNLIIRNVQPLRLHFELRHHHHSH